MRNTRKFFFFIFHSITAREKRECSREKIDINEQFRNFFLLFHWTMLKMEINIFIEIYFNETQITI